MKSNYSKFISVTLVLVVMLVVFAFPTPVYAGAKPPLGEQSAYAVFENNIGDVGTQIGSDSSPVTVDQDQYIFVCIQQDFTQALKDHDMANQWRTWGGTWETMAVIGAGSSTDWEYWDSNYATMLKMRYQTISAIRHRETICGKVIFLVLLAGTHLA